MLTTSNSVRHQAAEKPAKRTQDDSKRRKDLSPAGETAILLEDLHLHQIELEMQNEELLKAYAANSEIQTHYMRLFHKSPVGYLVVNGSGIITFANETFATLVHRAPDKIAGKGVADFIVESDRSLFISRFRALFKNPTGKEITVSLAGPGDSYTIHASLTYSRVPAMRGQQEGELLITVTDISERVRAQQEAEASREFSQDILNSLEAHICVLNRDGVILTVNTAWQQFAESNGANISDCGPGANYFQVCASAVGREREQAKQCAEGIRAVLSNSIRTFSMEYECHSPTEHRWFIARITRLSTAHDGHIVIAHANITERKKLEQRNQQQQAHINQLAKDESLSRLAGAVAHRYNNVMAAVLGNLELTLDHVPRDSEAAVSLNTALQAGWKASELGGMMLTYLGQSVEPMEELDLAEISRYFLSQIERNKPHHITMTIDLPPSGPKIRGSAKHFQQILSNLLTNAWEALESRDRCDVHITLGHADSSEIATEHRFPLEWQGQEDCYACLTVTDNGCGIADNHLDRIFEPFFTSKMTGRGMGLAVVVGILRNHGGVITAACQTGKGSSFKVYLPLLYR